MCDQTQRSTQSHINIGYIPELMRYVEHSSRALQIIPKLQFTNEHRKADAYMYTGAHKHYRALPFQI